jgi:hypothetical protein
LGCSDYWPRACITQEVILARQPVLFMKTGIYDLVTVGEALMG